MHLFDSLAYMALLQFAGSSMSYAHRIEGGRRSRSRSLTRERMRTHAARGGVADRPAPQSGAKTAPPRPVEGACPPQPLARGLAGFGMEQGV
jgi:hypothetical protein